MSSNERRSRLDDAGRWLREQRVRRGFATASEFARAIGTDPSRVSNYERGMSAVPDDRAEQIAEALRLDIITVRRNLALWVPEEEETPAPPAPGADVAAMTPDDFIAYLAEQILTYLQTHTARGMDAERMLREIKDKSA